MKKILLLVGLMILMFSACVVAPAHRGEGGILIAPALPAVVELNYPDDFYFYSDYYYQYRDKDWYYSHEKKGPWQHLPQDRHPREVRFKHGSEDRDRGWDQNRDRDHDHDRENDRDRDHEGH